MTTAAGLKAQAKYDKNNTKQIALKMNLKYDADILGKLNNVDNMQGYIKGLIRKDMRSESDVLPVETIKLLVLPVAKKYDFTQLYIFGSYARGEANSNSDIDILSVDGNINNLFEYNDVVNMLEESIGKKVDLVMNEAVEKDSTRSGKRFKERLDKEKLLIYEKK